MHKELKHIINNLVLLFQPIYCAYIPNQLYQTFIYLPVLYIAGTTMDVLVKINTHSWGVYDGNFPTA